MCCLTQRHSTHTCSLISFVQITELAIEAELPRTDVLAWLRQMEKAPEECVPLLAESCCICVSLQALCKDARLVSVACLTRQATRPSSLDLLKPRCQLASYSAAFIANITDTLDN